jgi:DNA replicative helicase MCM subunit Mcm2 (Cdc46/Mcm family)
MKTPRRLLPLFDAALADTQLSVLETNPTGTHADGVHSRTPARRAHTEETRDVEAGTDTASDHDTEGNAEENAEENVASPLLFKPKCHVRLKNVFFAGLDRLPRALDSNRLVAVRGTVIRASAIKMLEWRREIECTRCKHRWTVQADIEQHYRFDDIAQCPSGRWLPLVWGVGGWVCMCVCMFARVCTCFHVFARVCTCVCVCV